MRENITAQDIYLAEQLADLAHNDDNVHNWDKWARENAGDLIKDLVNAREKIEELEDNVDAQQEQIEELKAQIEELENAQAEA